MEFKDMLPTIKDELGEELLELSKRYLKEQFKTFQDAEKRFNKSREDYEKVLETEITEEYLRKQGYNLKDNDPSFERR